MCPRGFLKPSSPPLSMPLLFLLLIPWPLKHFFGQIVVNPLECKGPTCEVVNLVEGHWTLVSDPLAERLL